MAIAEAATEITVFMEDIEAAAAAPTVTARFSSATPATTAAQPSGSSFGSTGGISSFGAVAEPVRHFP